MHGNWLPDGALDREACEVIDLTFTVMLWLPPEVERVCLGGLTFAAAVAFLYCRYAKRQRVFLLYYFNRHRTNPDPSVVLLKTGLRFQKGNV